MDRIKEAIERAAQLRAEKLASGSVEPVTVSANQKRALQVIEVKPPATHIDEIDYPITYENTKVHEASADWFRKNRILNDESDPKVVHGYKLLRTQVLKKLATSNWKSIGIISARSGQGSSLTAVNLAISIAKEHRYTVLLADFNLRQPGIHKLFGYQPEKGIGDYISDDVPVNEMLFNPGIESLVVLPGRDSLADSSEQLTSPKIQELVRDIRFRYQSRIIIYDLPPLLEQVDAIAFIDQFDAGLLVVEDNKTTKTEIEKIAELIGDKPMLGTVLNKADG